VLQARHWIAALVVCAAACDLGAGGTSRSAVGMDGGVCVRDLSAIEDLLAHPVACGNDEQCPLGAFCNTSRGACDWQCTTDNHSGPSGTCGCDGRCTNSA
jgi:hypothetical protein